MSDCSEGGYVVRAQGLDSEVTGESEARMPNEGFSAPKGALAERRYTAAPSKRPQDSTQTVSLLPLWFPAKNIRETARRNIASALLAIYEENVQVAVKGIQWSRSEKRKAPSIMREPFACVGKIVVVTTRRGPRETIRS